MTAAKLLPIAIIVPLFIWRVYVRARRNIGPQPLHRRQLKVRMGIFAAVALLLGGAAAWHWPMLGALGGGLACGVPLALIGLRLTRFETKPDGHVVYVPNTLIGVALTLLLLGRLVYRFGALSSAMAAETMTVPPTFQSPMTFAIFGLTAGYYIAYYAGVLIRGREHLAG